MFWQREILRDAVSMAFGETWQLDLPKSGQLGSVVLYLSSSENGYPFLTTQPKWRLIDWITKIEVIGDGAEVIKSFDGPEALAAALYDDGVEPPGMWRTYSNTPHRQWIPIHFGRKLMDEIYGLNLDKFHQVTLKITNNATSTEYSTDIKVTAFAYWKREDPTPFYGYFREEVWKSWLPVAAATEYANLPVGLPIRRIILEARPALDTADCKNNSTMIALMNDINFTKNGGQTRVYKGNLNNLGMLSIIEAGKYVVTRGIIDKTAAYGFEVGIGYVLQAIGSGMPDQSGVSAEVGTMQQDVQDSAQEQSYRGGNGSMAWVCRGFGYHHTVPLFVAKEENLADLLKPAGDGDVKVDISCTTGLTLTGTSRNARNAIILNRLVQ